MTDPHEHFERVRRRHEELMARAFGRRPSGQEHRAWVDHEGLRAKMYDERDFAGHMAFTGLAQIPPNDPAAPPELRALLRAASSGWLFVLGFGALLFVLGYSVGLAFYVFWLGMAVSDDLFGMAVIPGFLLAVLGSALGGDTVKARFKSWLGVEPPGSRAHAVDRALRALRARPFVVRIGDVLVENLPSLSQLAAWEEELGAEVDEARSRERVLTELLTRIGQLSAGLGEASETDHTLALREAVATERTLRERASTLRAFVRGRAEQMHAELAELRQRTELDVLRAKADATLGRARPDADLMIQTALDLDLDQLGAEIASLRAELLDERLRARALTEVGAIRSG